MSKVSRPKSSAAPLRGAIDPSLGPRPRAGDDLRRSDLRPVTAPQARRRGGFALLITVTLLAFLVLLLVSLATFTRVETQVAGNSQQAASARQNALLALNLALGQLQKFAGPDRRVTARADLGNAADNALPAPQDGARQWTGVWGNAAASAADHGSPVFLNWLVSGNENVTLSTDADGTITSAAAAPDRAPDQPISSLASATALSTNLTIGSGDQKAPARLLVGPGTVGTATDPGGLGPAGYVVAPLTTLSVAGNLVPGQSATAATPVGRCAWWIGDDGVKARANLVENEAAVTATDDAEKRLRYRVSPRAGVELLDDASATLAGSDFAATSSSALRDQFRKVVSTRQLGLVSAGAAFPDAFLREHYHDLTSASLGVLSDTLAGGLRKDLTAAFAPGTGKNDAPTGPIWSVGSNDADKGPDWQLLRSYCQLPVSTGASGTGAGLKLDPRPQIDGTTAGAGDAQEGVFPVVAFWQWHIEARLVGSWPSYHLELHHYPAIVLWNPYNVTLADHAYRVSCKIAGGNVAFVRVSPRTYGSDGTTETDYAGKVPPATSVDAQIATPWTDATTPALDNPMKFAVQSGDLNPGEAYVYTLPADVTYTTNDFTPYTLTRGWHGGGTNAVVVKSPDFTLTGAAGHYMVSFWCGTNTSGNGNAVPAWDKPTPNPVPTSSGSNTEPTLREDTTTLATASGDPLQIVSQTNNYQEAFKMRFVASSFLYQDLGAAGQTIGYVGHRWALKTTAPGTLDNATYYKNNPVRWLADYNPRAPFADRSPFDSQGGGTGYGYFYTNPNYNFGYTTPTSYGSGAFDPPNDNAIIECDPDTGRAFVGMSQKTWDPNLPGESTVVLFDVPRAEHPVLSLGQLQHAQLYRVNGVPFAANYSPAYAFGNSLADPRGNLDTTNKPWSEIAITGNGYFAYKTTARVFDHSYLLNRALWDRYYFSTVPRGAAGSPVTFPLPDPRLAFRDRGSAAASAELRDQDQAAASLLVSGAFNVNSTSASAWRALLGGPDGIPVGATRRAGEAPYPRLNYPFDDASVLDATAAGDAGMKAAAYQGYRFLTKDDIKTLADAIVTQVRRRGPFVSLADFVNRALVQGPVPAKQDNRLMGALAQAIADAGLNNAFASGTPAKLPPPNSTSSSAYTEMVATAAAGPAATGVPGWLTQADLLQPLGPALSARSDTFTVRAYGETVNPALSASDPAYVQGRAWCEAVVQRLPDYVAAGDDPWTAPAALTQPDNRAFGRRFKIVSFRWLSPDDI